MRRSAVTAAAAGLVLVGCATAAPPPTETVVESLSQPRGLDVEGGRVCVAEAGSPGPLGKGTATSRAGSAAGSGRVQVEADTGRVVCRTTDGSLEVVVDRLPFVHYPDAAVTSGAADVVRRADDLYVLVGESYGRLARSIVAVGDDGTVTEVADLLAYAESTLGANSAVRSNPYSMVPTHDGEGFLVADAATGTILEVGFDGTVELFAALPGHAVVAGLAWGPGGDVYVASFGSLPHPAGSGAVLAVDARGRERVVLDGLTMPIDLGFDEEGGLYVLEYSSPPDDPEGTEAYRDASGRLLHTRLDEAGPPRVVLDGLDRPTAVAIADGRAWISVSGGELAPAEGEVVVLPLASSRPSAG